MVIREENCFYPDSFTYFNPESAGFEKQEFWIDDRINCWFVLPKENRKDSTIVHLHGNAENMSSHITALLFLLELGYPLLAFDYSGYGKSKGKPSLQGIQADAKLVFDHISKESSVFGKNIFGFGQSMGAYTLARILPNIPWIKGAIFDSGLTSFYDLFTQAYPYYQCDIPHKNLSALDTLPKSSVPKLFIHGTADEVVPYTHSIEMHDVAAEPKDILILDGVAHIAATASPKAKEYISKITSFLEKYRANSII
jgi:fermentation-respiration switch protein FrsA (DUF1100 family)